MVLEEARGGFGPTVCGEEGETQWGEIGAMVFLNDHFHSSRYDPVHSFFTQRHIDEYDLYNMSHRDGRAIDDTSKKITPCITNLGRCTWAFGPEKAGLTPLPQISPWYTKSEYKTPSSSLW